MFYFIFILAVFLLNKVRDYTHFEFYIVNTVDFHKEIRCFDFKVGIFLYSITGLQLNVSGKVRGHRVARLPLTSPWCHSNLLSPSCSTDHTL